MEISLEHEFIEISDTAGVLSNLFSCFGVENCQAGVDVPFLAVDAQHDVDFDVFDTADVTTQLPGELAVSVPCFAHGEESGVRDGLGVCCDAVMFFSGKVDKLGAEAGKDGFDLVEGRVWSAMLDEDEGLVVRVDGRAVERVARDDRDVGWEMSFEGLDLRPFT